MEVTVEAVEAVAVDEDLLEDSTGVVGREHDRNASLDNSSSRHSVEVVSTVVVLDTRAISVPGPRRRPTLHRRQEPAAVSMWLLARQCRTWRMLVFDVPVNVSVGVVLRG